MKRNLVYLLAVGAVAFAVWKYLPADKTGSNYAGGNGSDSFENNADGEPMIDVIVPELSTVASEGKVLFDENCAVCHGENVRGIKGMGPTLVHKIYIPNHHGDGAFLIAAKFGVRQHHWTFGNMPAVEGVTNEDVTKIVAYVRELQKANGL